MKILALILARGGSKRLPGKNIRDLGGKPLVVWSIDLAMSVKEISEVLVSTDSQVIAEVAKEAGALAPWLRPAHLATDNASSFDATIHALDWYEGQYGHVDGLLLLQPTSPFRKLDRLIEMLTLFELDRNSPVVSVCNAQPKPELQYVLDRERLVPVLDWEAQQHLRPCPRPIYTLNGSLYLIAPNTLRDERNFVPQNSRPILMTEFYESIDIDTEWDWVLAEEAIKRDLIGGQLK